MNHWKSIDTPPTADDADSNGQVMAYNILTGRLMLNRYDDMWDIATHWAPPPHAAFDNPLPPTPTSDDEFDALLSSAKMKLTNLIHHLPKVAKDARAVWSDAVAKGRELDK